MPDQEKQRRVLGMQARHEQANEAVKAYYGMVAHTMNTNEKYRQAVYQLAASREGLQFRDLPLDDLVLEDALTVGLGILMSGNLDCMISDLKREQGLQ